MARPEGHIDNNITLMMCLSKHIGAGVSKLAALAPIKQLQSATESERLKFTSLEGAVDASTRDMVWRRNVNKLKGESICG